MSPSHSEKALTKKKHQSNHTQFIQSADRNDYVSSDHLNTCKVKLFSSQRNIINSKSESP